MTYLETKKVDAHTHGMFLCLATNHISQAKILKTMPSASSVNKTATFNSSVSNFCFSSSVNDNREEILLFYRDGSTCSEHFANVKSCVLCYHNQVLVLYDPHSQIVHLVELGDHVRLFQMNQACP